jgi:NAD(P)-dependent dehydrogenase (short-subunit alcohol dehydrogenase family)
MIALITGANKGIGYETARLLGERDDTVLIGCRNPALGQQAAATLPNAHFVELDVTDEESVKRAAHEVGEKWGRLDVLINNAGIVRADGSGLPSQTTAATMREVYETNVFGVITVTNAFLPLLRQAPAARIVNVSSEVGSIESMTDRDSPLWMLVSAAYPSSKSALNMVTAMYAKELVDSPIKVNAANPGYCATDFNHHSGFRTAEEGARVSVHLATLPSDGVSGKLWGYVWRADGTGGDDVIAW